MLPSTKLTVDDVLSILRRRAGLVIVTFAAVSGLSAAATLVLPNRFRSETLILVVPQRVPEAYVKSTVTARIEDRLQSITQEILSRTRLERIIQDFDLYRDARRTRLMETIVEDMRRDIDVKVVKGDAFRVAYVGADASTVMQVTNRLASLFIEENLRDREQLADGTNHFLEAQLADARRRLVEHEKTLERYRSRFSRELPSQLAPNLQVIQNVQLQIQALTDSTNRDLDRRTLLERQLRETERELAIGSAAAGAQGATAPSSSSTVDDPASQRLAAARAAFVDIERRLGPSHPDLQRMQRVVSVLEVEAAAEVQASAASLHRAPPTMSANEARLHARAGDLRVELDQLDREIASRKGEEQRLQAVTRDYQQRIERVPTRESELAELTRDYSTLQSLYQTLLAKQEESKIAANLERRQIGAQFKLLDPARIAEKPFSPRRWLIDLGGMTAGLGIALGLIALLEYRDRTFNTDTEIGNELALAVLAVVPLMTSTDDGRHLATRRLLTACAIAAVVIASLPVVVYSILH